MSNSSFDLINQLAESHVVFLVDKQWVFDEPILPHVPIWPVIDQVFFKNNPRVQNLVFAVPCWVLQFRLASLFSESSYVRVLVIHGPDLSLLIRAVNQFMALNKTVVAKVFSRGQPWNQQFLQKTLNQCLKSRYDFDQLDFFMYEKAHHHTLPGQWQELGRAEAVTGVPDFLLGKKSGI